MSHTPQDLHNTLVEHFSEDELKNLCFTTPALHEAPDDWADNDNKRRKARLLVAFCENRQILDALERAIRNSRPNTSPKWQMPQTTFTCQAKSLARGGPA